MVYMCEQAGISLFANYMRRCDPGAIEIKQRIQAGEISFPMKANAWYTKGLLNNGSHFVNLLEYWIGNITSTALISRGRLWDNSDPEPDFKVDFELGAAIFRSAWEESFSYYCVEILSNSGRLRYDSGGESIEWLRVHADQNFSGYKILGGNRNVISNGMHIYQWHVYDQLCKHLSGMEAPRCTVREALKTLESIYSVLNQR